MARTVDSIIKDQLGQLLTQVAILTAEVESRGETIEQLKAEVASLKAPDPKSNGVAKDDPKPLHAVRKPDDIEIKKEGN